MPNAEATLSTIAVNARGKVTESCSTLFHTWLDRQHNASWRQLIEALKEVGLHIQAMEIENKLQPSTERMLESSTVLEGMILT